MLVATCLFFIGLGGLPLLEPDEGRNAEIAREMLTSADWITPHFDTLTYLDKPAVFYWLVAVSFRLWGISEWAARFPSALMALGTLLLTWTLARRMFGDSTALRAGIILATSPLALAPARLVTLDMTLTFFVTLALTSFWLAESHDAPPAWVYALLFGAMGAATIIKGPAGFLLPLLSILTFLSLRRRFGELKGFSWGLGAAVFLAVTLPWFIAVSVRHPDFPLYALWQESVKRFTTGHARRTGSLGYYIPVYLAGFFPWSLFLLLAGCNRLKRWREMRAENQKPILFLLVWAGAIFLFFSISHSKLPAYFLPAAIPVSILMGRAWGEVGDPEKGRPPDWLTAGFAVLLALGLLVALLSHFPLLGAMQARVAKKLHPSFILEVKPCLLYSGLILVALAIIGRNLAKRLRGSLLSGLTFALLALAVPSLLVRWISPLKTFAATTSSRALAEAILASPEKDLPLYGYYYFRTSLPFYLRQPVGLITAGASETTSNYVAYRWSQLRGGAEGARIFIPHSGEAPKLGESGTGRVTPVLLEISEAIAVSSQRPILVLVRNTQATELQGCFQKVEPLWASWEYSVWKASTKFQTGK